MNDGAARSDQGSFTAEDAELAAALEQYEDEKQQGQAPPIDEMVVRFPSIANRLRACLSGLAAVDSAVEGFCFGVRRRPFLPKQLGDFEIICPLGRGGMGEVYRAQQVSLNRPVALKVLSQHWGWTPSSRKRFHREAQAAAKLHHTNIVGVYAEGEEDGACYYAMELIDGPSLDLVIAFLRGEANLAEPSGHEESDVHESTAGPANLPNTLLQSNTANFKSLVESSSLSSSARERCDLIANWVAAIAEALDYAHERGIIHRDVKPSNLLLGSDGRLRLTDFGLARITQEAGMTVTGEMLGTAHYMSPEQIAAGTVDVDARTDVYSLGATLYELLTLSPPYPGNSRDQIILQIIHQEPRQPRQIDSTIPVDLETICLKALEKDADHRYQTASQLAEDLRRYINRYAIAAKRVGPITRFTKWARRHPSIAVLSAFLVIAAIAICLLAWQTRLANKQITSERLQTAIDRALAESMGGDFAKAAEAVRQAELNGAPPGWVRMLEGQIALNRGDMDVAKNHLEQAVKLMPDSLAANALRGRAYIYTDSYEFGLTQKPRIDSLAPQSPEDLIFLGFYYSVYDPARAVDILNDAIRQRDSSVARLIRASALAGHAQRTGDVIAAERAATDAEAAQAMLPGNKLALATNIEAHSAAANGYALAANEPLRQQHLRRGEQLVTQVDLDSATDHLLFMVACFWDRQGDRGKTLQAWRRAASRGLVRSIKHCLCELYRNGLYDDAIEVCHSAPDAAQDTHIPPVRLLLMAESGELAAARQELERIAQESKEPAQVMYLALVARILGMNEWADEFCQQAKPPDDPFPRALMKFNRVQIGADELIAAAPGDALYEGEAHYHIAHRELGNGRRRQAAEHFRVMADLNTYYFYEYRWARAFLERLESDPRWPSWIPAQDE